MAIDSDSAHDWPTWFRGVKQRTFLLRPLVPLAIAAAGFLYGWTSYRKDRLTSAVALARCLNAYPHRIVWEHYEHGNWDIYAMDADGSHKVNLTNTPHRNEHYPQVSPDGRRIAYTVDEGRGRSAVRSVWVMDTDGTHARKLADRAREPFWAPDSRSLGYLPQEYPKFDVADYYTAGMMFCDVSTGKIRPHPNSAGLRHLYNPCYSPDGKWIVATVHGGMGFAHTNVLIEAHGDRVIDLHIGGCRPNLSRDGKRIAWGLTSGELDIAPIDLNVPVPVVGAPTLRIQDPGAKIYHVDWSPDGRYIAFSRGPEGEGDPTKPGTFIGSSEVVGVYAKGWNICVVPTDLTGTLDLETASPSEFAQLTTDGDSNKEPDWTDLPPTQPRAFLAHLRHDSAARIDPAAQSEHARMGTIRDRATDAHLARRVASEVLEAAAEHIIH